MSDSSEQNTLSPKSWLIIGLIFAVGLGILYFVAQKSAGKASHDTRSVRTAPDDPIIARLNGDVITESQLDLARSFFSQDDPDGGLISRDMAMDRLIQQRLLVQLALERDLESQIDTQNRIRFARDLILAEDALNAFLASAVSDEEIKTYYEQETRKWAGQVQIKARQIVLPDEATAKEISRRLDDGEAFASLALAYSLDRASRESGGDLGYLNRDMLDPLLTDKIFAAEDGARIDRFETPQGWHVVEIIGRRKAPVASFEDREDAIRSLLQAQKLQARLSELETAGNLEILNSVEE